MQREGEGALALLSITKLLAESRGMKAEKGLQGSGEPLNGHRMHDGKSWPSLEGPAGWVTWNLESLCGITLQPE